MRRGLVALSALALLAVALVGCGRFGFEQREPWRAQAEEACLSARLVTPTAYMSRSSEIDGPGACGITYPFRVAALAGGTVGLSNRLTLGCPIIPEVNAWLTAIVQPAAQLYYGQELAEIRAGSYSCRGRNNRVGAKLSEHSFGNAVDIMAFKFADGRVLTVEKGWKGNDIDQEFLREVFVGACTHFTTVLGPGSDIYHYNHFHLDLARHDPRGRRRICKPAIKFEPRIDPDRPAAAVAARPVPGARPMPQPAEPLEIDEEGDPFAVSQGPAAGSAARPAARPVAENAWSPSAGPLKSVDPSRPVYGQTEGRMQTRPTTPASAPLVLQPQLGVAATIY